VFRELGLQNLPYMYVVAPSVNVNGSAAADVSSSAWPSPLNTFTIPLPSFATHPNVTSYAMNWAPAKHPLLANSALRAESIFQLIANKTGRYVSPSAAPSSAEADSSHTHRRRRASDRVWGVEGYWASFYPDFVSDSASSAHRSAASTPLAAAGAAPADTSGFRFVRTEWGALSEAAVQSALKAAAHSAQQTARVLAVMQPLVVLLVGGVIAYNLLLYAPLVFYLFLVGVCAQKQREREKGAVLLYHLRC
jgi:hypothetical protein